MTEQKFTDAEMKEFIEKEWIATADLLVRAFHKNSAIDWPPAIIAAKKRKLGMMQQIYERLDAK